ncbi:hypothetical protein SJAG_01445 [Schizosaccharomyces japonicus yFS275]|uniref:Transmembrane 9 superfamily member n=1 Tax=Schizosaccharomyces japonicus (strain yFS275 / FY16936) TaxID=402676 RepID=B6JXY5_SCHJY|nr:hypothetical protein SJAG_01445 [Schizosaccharomyces japonicus yFS275]EEB06403.1 hypothetical protein SJAG_01445 [Schizosaccharomyces japonicus yFS275]
MLFRLAILLQLFVGIFAHANEYRSGDELAILVGHTSSTKSPFTYTYYDLPFVCPFGSTKASHRSSLGDVLMDNRFSSTNFQIRMLQDVSCKNLCELKLSDEGKGSAKEYIENEYKINWSLDDLPAALKPAVTGKDVRYVSGIPFGNISYGKVFLYNHFDFIIRYRPASLIQSDKWQIVGFEVLPISQADATCPDAYLTDNKDVSGNEYVLDSQVSDVQYSYSVRFVLDEQTTWGQRMKKYVTYTSLYDRKYGFMNAIIIIFLLSTFVTGIVSQQLFTKKYENYEQLQEEGLESEDSDTWKLVKTDVFRPPAHPRLFSALFGAGCQFAAMCMFLVLLGFLGWAQKKASVVNSAIALYVLTGVFAGYFSQSLYHSFGTDKEWKKVGVLTASLVPFLVSFFGMVINFFFFVSSSSRVIPFSTILGLLALWVLINAPLVFVGSAIALRWPIFEQTIVNSQVSRSIPRQPWYLKFPYNVLFSGCLPFCSIFVEVCNLLAITWKENNAFFFFFDYLFGMIVVITLTISLTAIISVYTLLQSENYHWWWHSLLIGASPAIYLLLYAIYFYFQNLRTYSWNGVIVYYGNCAIGICIFVLYTSTVSFLSSLLFVKTLFKSIKSD